MTYKGYIARDKDGSLFFFRKKPWYDALDGMWFSYGKCIELPKSMKYNFGSNREPMKATLKIEIDEDKTKD